MDKYLTLIKNYWASLQDRERQILGWGSLIVAIILFYALIWQPWHRAIAHMEGALPSLRNNLVWIRQQSATLDSHQSNPRGAVKDADQSLLSIVEKTASQNRVRDAIQKLTPVNQDQQVNVVLEKVNFNQWLRWIETLNKDYGVSIQQFTAERDDKKANQAEIRVIFSRN